MTSTYLTVAIPYVNAAPHVGYAYELVLADICARARRARPEEALRFLGGTDDYSLKNVLAAEAAGVPVRDFVARHAQRFSALCDPLSLSFDDFIHTSGDARHAPAVNRLWNAVAAHGDLYRRSYHGDYCVGCEQFYAPAELVDGCCPEHGTPIERVEEDNWFFRLSAYQEFLAELISSGRLEVSPPPFRQEALAFVRAGLTDISVSRSARRARGWGIPVPGDPSQVVYVWIDALANYISALDYGTVGSAGYRRWWLESDQRVHVVGKGILRFHAVVWPAILASAGEPGPTRVHVHPYLSLHGSKLSKSSGTTIDPVDVVERFGVDALRWWFARGVHPSVDTDFTLERLVGTANEDLANGIGNLVNRIATLVHRYRSGLVPSVESPPIAAVHGLAEHVIDALADFDLRLGTQLIADAVGALNKDLEVTAPWALAKDPALADELDVALVRCLRSAAEIVAALAPVLPDLARRLADQLAEPGHKLASPEPGFKRIER